VGRTDWQPGGGQRGRSPQLRTKGRARDFTILRPPGSNGDSADEAPPLVVILSGFSVPLHLPFSLPIVEQISEPNPLLGRVGEPRGGKQERWELVRVGWTLPVG
jgi:hypothetical protein